jgi:long-subunit fatty acid transport protein
LTSIGVGYRWDNRTQVNAGVAYVASPVDDDDRALYLPLDDTWIFGIGVERELDNGDIFTANLEYIDIGEAPVDQENSALSGRVKGEYQNNYAVLLDLSYRFNF